MKRAFRNKLLQRKRSLRLTRLPRIRVKVGTDKKGFIHYLFGYYGKEDCPTQYDENGMYIQGQPWYCWASGTIHRPDYKPRWNRELKRQFWNYLRINIKNIHPLDLAK
ncbi:hypothetical protein [Pedobacter antarcticus]|uniref:hypothetical protein n=1 Tax=Pedobacter antarcticus TaxID=34086 RepID=UPI00292EFC5D|nr:hypothetical protein [Pedobacter antarcticus]